MTSRDDVMRDPVAFVLALAFADTALKGITSVQKFADVKPRSEKELFTFEWNDEVLDQPVFRLVDRTKGLTEDA